MATTTRAGWAGMSACLAALFLATPLHAEEASFAGRFVRIDRDWGDVEVGETDGASSRLMVTGPATEFWPTAGLGSGRSTKAAYFTELRHDLAFGVSYAPIADGTGLGDALHMVEAALRHGTSLGGARLDFTVGGVGAQARNPLLAAPLRSLMAGGEVVWRQLTMGAAVRDQKADAGARRSWTAGLLYQAGDWSVRGQVARTVTAGEATSGGWNTAVRYVVTPGIALTAGLSQSGAEAETTVMRLGTRIRF
ncbi:porin [Azospirillum sp. ST 5-10]|uniref:porin n=1 Tax=unclassified Azospirillum TaxID=2630922 RepID=UPI003F4A4DAB